MEWLNCGRPRSVTVRYKVSTWYFCYSQAFKGGKLLSEAFEIFEHLLIAQVLSPTRPYQALTTTSTSDNFASFKRSIKWNWCVTETLCLALLIVSISTSREAFDLHPDFSSANHITGWCALSVAQGRVRNAALQYIAPSIFAQLRRGEKKERNAVFQYFSLSIFAQLRRWEKKDAQGSEAHRYFASYLRGVVLQYCCKTNLRHLWGHRSPSCRVGLAFFKV